MSEANKPVEAIGSQRANSPLWATPLRRARQSRPNIREQLHLPTKDEMFAKEEESLYTVMSLLPPSPASDAPADRCSSQRTEEDPSRVDMQDPFCPTLLVSAPHAHEEQHPP